jgi:uncharacterized membrane protein YfcA
MVVMPFLAVLFAGLMSGMTGFGFSVLAVPVLVLAYPAHHVVVIVLVLVPVTSVGLLMTRGLRGAVNRGLCTRLCLLSLVGLPFGALVFERYDPRALTLLMGIVITGFVAFSLYSPEQWQLPRILIFPSGVLGGVLASSTGLSGPAVAMYVHGRRMTHNEVVATMAAYVSIVSGLGLGALAIQGQIKGVALAEVWPLIPGSLAGVAVGRWWAVKNHQSIERVALRALGLMGIWTVCKAVLG